MDIDRRTYDLMRLIRENEPIGSIRLVDLMNRHGYSIKSRTIRLILSELDEKAFTEKVPGKGRKLTAAGRAELGRGNIAGRFGHIREKIVTLTSQVTYDPVEDAGEVVAGSAVVPHDSVDEALSVLDDLADSSLGPVVTATDAVDEGVRFQFPSSITLDGVLLSRGINTTLKTAGLVEYRSTPGEPTTPGEVVRYIDVINGEGSTMDVVTLLIEAGRTDVLGALVRDTGILIVDNREFPITRFEEARDLAITTTTLLGGALDVRRPREQGPIPKILAGSSPRSPTGPSASWRLRSSTSWSWSASGKRSTGSSPDESSSHCKRQGFL
ncbi:NrpR regulatory domain-containing protein [Haladaptatus sp. GCM10026878]|uniref:NrpR regulatory domain-containing protein n=1 Tax=Haladaptatus sp. GCM10026878 TaxID=3252660 RepID=UPI00360EAEE0